MVGFLASLLAIGFLFGAEVVNGAGSTFVYPLLSRWAYFYYKERGVRINYQSIGSGGGIRQITNRTVDFGASDAPLTPKELRRKGLIQFPVIIGGVVVAYNLPVKDLKLSKSALCKIFLGEVKFWDDPLIRKFNGGKKLPHWRIRVIHRSDGSGTTWIFTNFLSKSCKEWSKRVGFGKAVNWPTGIGAKGNEGVAGYIKRFKGAIGYVEFAYALENKLKYALVENREGNFVRPSIRSFQSAARFARWDERKGFYEVLTWKGGKNSYPITGATFILLAKDYPKERNKKVLDFFFWAFKKGDGEALKLNYVPLPKSVKAKVVKYLKGWLGD